MINLIRAEIFKLTSNKTFWVLTISIVILSSLLHYLVITDWWMMTGTPFELIGLSEWNALFPFITPLFFNLIISTIAAFCISIEFSKSGVMKNQMMSGHKRSHIFIAKYLIYSIGSFVITVFIPLLTAMLMVLLWESGEIFNQDNISYLARAFSLFSLHFICFTAVVFIIAIFTEDSGKTILFTLLVAISMFVVEKFVTSDMVNQLYEYTFFYQFNKVFHPMISSEDIIQSIVIGVVSFIVIISFGVFAFNRKEIK